MAKISLDLDALKAERASLGDFLARPDAYGSPDFTVKNKRFSELETLIAKGEERAALEQNVLTPASGAVGSDDFQSGGGVQSDGSGGGQVVAFSFEVTTTSASGGSDGGTTTTTSSSGGADVQPTCWYEPKKTGREMVAGRRGAADESGLSRLILPDKEAASAHADDNGDRWYQK